MTVTNINTETILPSASEQENRVMVSILNNLIQNFEVAQSHGKLHEFLQEYAIGIISINQKVGLLPDVKFESEYSNESLS
ncbi:MAG: hypothetical protein HOD90_10240 [Nitrospina sp.]|jgi:hypothetical protein|nr:hypothetical protein [Bacteriovoracaceae bacterium]MBT4260273.1 hypothetical protein [Nitrospina sp.]